MVTQIQIINYDKLLWQHREFLMQWMRESEGRELWGGVEVGDSAGLKEEQGVVERGVGSCSWILSAAAHSSPTCWDSFLACKSSGSWCSSIFFFLSFLKLCFSVKQSLDCIKMLQMETCVPGNEANDASVLFSYSGGPENIPSSILQIINHQTSKKFSLISYAWF